MPRFLPARMAALALAMGASGAESNHTVPFVPSAASEGHAGLVRIESRSEVPGEVRIVAVDDAGQRMDAGALTLGARAAVEFDMTALESGDASRGLTGTGAGEGDWRLELTTELDIEARAYAVTGGFPAALHDAALVSDEIELPFFNPGSETVRRSLLRLMNAGEELATLTVRGIDDAGNPGGVVTVELGAREARSYTASELESGSAPGVAGALGDGEGKWRLELSAEVGSAYATNLLLDGSGVLSSVPGGMSRGVFHRVALFPSASDGMGLRGLVRVVNRAAAPAELAIDAFDETDRRYDRLELALGAGASGQFDSAGLEQGAAEKGLSGSTGAGEGDWWLELTGGTDIEVLSYVDTENGPLSALRGTPPVAETDAGMRYEGLLWRDTGELRLLNAGAEPVDVRVTGTDDAGSLGGEVSLTLWPWTVRALTATALREGGAGLGGALGSGTGNWRLVLDTDGEIDVLSLVRGPGGMLSDLSRRGRPPGSPPLTEVIDATLGGRPDLWASASVSESELSPDEAFELRVAVGNRGEDDASATTLRYYRSVDAVITTGDTELGTDAVAALSASGRIEASTVLVAPSVPGTYYYGACVDPVQDEPDTSNNCSPAVPATVTAQPLPPPDLKVSSIFPSVNPPGFPESVAREFYWVGMGETTTVSATVTNDGKASTATSLRYYLTRDGTRSTPVFTVEVPPLGRHQTFSHQAEVAVPETPGKYFQHACVDAVPGEVRTLNNCDAERAFDVKVPELLDDIQGAIPSNCPLTVEICVTSLACEDGDRVRVSLNGTEVLTTEVPYIRWACASSAVNIGDNLLELYAINGTGRKGFCAYVNNNFGTLWVIQRLGSVGMETHRVLGLSHWSLPAGYLDSLNLNITYPGIRPLEPCPEE